MNKSELPDKCPSCGAKLKAYHTTSPIVTRLVCIEKCNGYHVVIQTEHDTGWWRKKND